MCFAGGDSGSSSSGSSGSVSGGSLALQLAGAFASARAARDRSSADRAALEYQSQVQANAGQVDEWRAADAIRRGETAQSQSRLRQTSIAGSQRAVFAARGLPLNEGSALSILSDTAFMGDVDAATIRDNAAKEAWTLRVSANTARSNSDFLAARARTISPGRSEFNSLLTSAGTVAPTWYRLNPDKTSTSTSGKTIGAAEQYPLYD